jgi:hypothetical protein
MGVGTRFRSEIASMGRTLEMAIEFTGYERPRRLASSGMVGRVAIVRLDYGCAACALA